MFRVCLHKLSQGIAISPDDAASILLGLADRIEQEQDVKHRNRLITFGREVQSYQGPTERLSQLAREVSMVEHDRLVKKSLSEGLSSEEMLSLLNESDQVLDYLKDDQVKIVLKEMRELAVEAVRLHQGEKTPDAKTRLEQIMSRVNELAMKINVEMEKVVGPDIARKIINGNMTETFEIKQPLEYDPWAACEEEAGKQE